MKRLIYIYTEKSWAETENRIFSQSLYHYFNSLLFSLTIKKNRKKKSFHHHNTLFCMCKDNLVMWNRQTDKQTDIERQTDIDGWWCRERERPREDQSREVWALLRDFPSLSVCGDCLQSQISVEISSIHLHSLYKTHIYTYTPTCIPSLQMPLHLYLLWHPRRHFLEKMKQCWWLPCLKLSVFFSFIMSVSPYHLFFLCNLLCLPLLYRFVLFIYWLWVSLNELYGLARWLVISFQHIDFG